MHRGLTPSAGWIAVPLVAAAALLPGLRAGPSLDAAVFGLIGRQLASGAVPYVDAWDHKPPGIHLVHALADVLPIATQWEWAWLLTALVTSVTSWLLAATLRTLVGTWIAVGAGLVCALMLGHFILSLGGGMSESFALLPATASVHLAARTHGSASRAGIAGLLLGVAVVISPQLAPAGLAGLVLVWGSGLRSVVALVGGAVLPVLAVVAWLMVVGALPAFLDALLRYGAAYRTVDGPGFGLLPWVVLALMVIVAPALAGAASLRRASAASRRLGLASVAWIVAAVILIAVQGRLYGHYAIGVVPPLAILAAIGVSDLVSRVRGRAVRLAAGGIGVGLLVLSLVVGAAAARMELAMIEAAGSRAEALAGWAAEQGESGDSMLVWGNAPQAYLSTGTMPAGRHGFLYPLTTPGYASESMVRDELRRLEASPPTLVVDAGSPAPGEPGFLPLLIDRPIATDGRDLDLLDPVRSFVAAGYELADVVEGWPVYRLSRDGG